MTQEDESDARNESVNEIEDPYAVLNVSRRASLEDIQKCYKLLSRTFHPDKQPPGPFRDAAQQNFIRLKSSYDILVDPVLRLAFDEHGIDGVVFLKKSNSLYKDLQDLWSMCPPSEQRDKYLIQMRQILAESIQFYYFHNKGIDYSDGRNRKKASNIVGSSSQGKKPGMSGEIKIKCSTTHSPFLGEGTDTQSHLLEVESVNISVAVMKPQSSSGATEEGITTKNKSVTFGAHSGLTNGVGRYGGQLSIQYEPLPNTDLTTDFNFSESLGDTQVTLGTARVLSSRTYISSSVSTPLFPQLSSSKQGSVFSFTSHRSLFQDNYQGMFVVGLSQKMQLMYGLIQLSTNHPDQQTKYTAKCNVGMNYTPIQVIAEHSFSDEHKAKITCGLGPRGIDIQAILSRYLSKYCKLSLGLQHVSSKGLTCLFHIQRDTIKFSIPVFVTSSLSPAYALKTMYSGLFLSLLDASIGDFLTTDNIMYSLRQRRRSKISNNDVSIENDIKREKILMQREKIKRDAMQQQKLMKGPADAKRKSETDKNGLVILNAVYSVLNGDSIDVTDSLMFWVTRSSLFLPSVPKSNMLGFYDVRRTSNNDLDDDFLDQSFSIISFLDDLRRRFLRMFVVRDEQKIHIDTASPTLLVRYRFKGSLYEITANDEDELILPSISALLLGDASVY